MGDPAFGEGSEGSFHRWHGLPVGEIFHGHVDADGYPAPGPAAPFNRNGTYKVWRKLHEDVATFRSWVAEQAKTLEMSTSSCFGPSSSAGGLTAHRSRSRLTSPIRTWASIRPA